MIIQSPHAQLADLRKQYEKMTEHYEDIIDAMAARLGHLKAQLTPYYEEVTGRAAMAFVLFRYIEAVSERNADPILLTQVKRDLWYFAPDALDSALQTLKDEDEVTIVDVVGDKVLALATPSDAENR